MPFCMNCGSSMNEDDPICPACGHDNSQDNLDFDADDPDDSVIDDDYTKELLFKDKAVLNEDTDEDDVKSDQPAAKPEAVFSSSEQDNTAEQKETDTLSAFQPAFKTEPVNIGEHQVQQDSVQSENQPYHEQEIPHQPENRQYQGASNQAYNQPRQAPQAQQYYQGPSGYNYQADNRRLPVLEQGERPVRTYACCDIRFPKTQGFLTVTNKRLIFHADDNDKCIDKGVDIDTVSGLDAFYGIILNWKYIIFGVLLAWFALNSFSNGNVYYVGGYFVFFGVILLALSVCCFLIGIKKCFNLAVFASCATGSPMEIGDKTKVFFGSSARYSLSCTPSQDTDRMLSELGALVIDIQTMGDSAMQKWK